MGNKLFHMILKTKAGMACRRSSGGITGRHRNQIPGFQNIGIGHIVQGLAQNIELDIFYGSSGSQSSFPHTGMQPEGRNET